MRRMQVMFACANGLEQLREALLRGAKGWWSARSVSSKGVRAVKDA